METYNNNKYLIFSLKQAKRLVISLIFILLFEIFLFPPPSVLASETARISETAVNEELIQEKKGEITKTAAFENSLPENTDLKVAWTTYRTMTAYNSEIGQCDSTPCITANGFNLCEHGVEDSIAANWLKFGTKVRIPELFGDKVFVVRDRMNKRYTERVDIWMLEKETAKGFGRRIAKIEILETP